MRLAQLTSIKLPAFLSVFCQRARMLTALFPCSSKTFSVKPFKLNLTLAFDMCFMSELIALEIIKEYNHKPQAFSCQGEIFQLVFRWQPALWPWRTLGCTWLRPSDRRLESKNAWRRGTRGSAYIKIHYQTNSGGEIRAFTSLGWERANKSSRLLFHCWITWARDSCSGVAIFPFICVRKVQVSPVASRKASTPHLQSILAAKQCHNNNTASNQLSPPIYLAAGIWNAIAIVRELDARDASCHSQSAYGGPILRTRKGFTNFTCKLFVKFEACYENLENLSKRLVLYSYSKNLPH